jgi:hypothetical protein
MLITLEHNGSQEHVDAANEIAEYIEQELGMSSQIVSAHYSNEIFGYDEENRHIFSISLPLDKFDFGNIFYILSMME